MKKIREWFESLKEWWRKVLKKLAADNRKVFGKKRSRMLWWQGALEKALKEGEMKGIVVLAVLFLASILSVTHYEGRRSAYDSHERKYGILGRHMRGEKLYMHRFSDIGLSADQRKSMEDIERKFYDAEQELISQIENALKELYRAYERDVISDQSLDKRITIVASLLIDLTRKKLFLEK